MNCKKTQELIMTDYSDNEANDALRKDVERHLDSCNGCKDFKRNLQEAAIRPFRTAEKVKPPDFVWNRIKESIASGKEEKRNVLFNLRDSLYNVFAVRKPAFAVTAVIVTVIIALFLARPPLNGTELINSYVGEQIEFLTLLDVDATDSLDGEYRDLDTSIEEYLL